MMSSARYLYATSLQPNSVDPPSVDADDDTKIIGNTRRVVFSRSRVDDAAVYIATSPETGKYVQYSYKWTPLTVGNPSFL